MRKTAILAAVMATMAMLAGVTPVSAHHSFAATYFENQTVTVKGKLLQFMFRNPHSFVSVEAPDSKGAMQHFAVEWAGGGQLSRDGIGPQTLRPGDMVIVTGNPGRNPVDHRMRMLSITRPSDGFKWKGVVE